MGGWLGACHTLEVPFVFGTLGLPALRPFVGDGPEAERLSQTMRSAWIAFARDGSPDLPRVERWPRYDPHLRRTVRLDREVDVLDAPLEAERRFWDGIL
jgi:para-nitrobenzyl esterase